MPVNTEINWYVIAWSLYLAGSVLFLVSSWRFLSILKKFGIGAVLMMGLVAAVLVPWPVDDAQKGMLAPAWIVAGLDRVTNAQDGAMRAGIPLLMAIIFSAGISMLIVAIKAAFFPAAKQHPSQYAPPSPPRSMNQRAAAKSAGSSAHGSSETTQRNPRESLAAPPRSKQPAPAVKAKPTGRIEPRISDDAMNELTSAPKKRR